MTSGVGCYGKVPALQKPCSGKWPAVPSRNKQQLSLCLEKQMCQDVEGVYHRERANFPALILPYTGAVDFKSHSPVPFFSLL